MREYYNNEKFRRNLDYLLSKHKMTKSKLEKELDISDGLISKYCKIDGNSVEPKIGIVNSLAKFFNVKIDDLVNEDLEKRMKYIQAKEILFCNKLIDETKEGTCNWHKLNIPEDGFIDYEYYEEDTCILGSNWLEKDLTFRSKFMHDTHNISNLSAFTTMINEETMQVVIVQFSKVVDGELTYRYELYLINSDKKVSEVCASHIKDIHLDEVIYNEDIYNILKEIYSYAYNNELDLVYDEYLR